jgi:hypothetical protein
MEITIFGNWLSVGQWLYSSYILYSGKYSHSLGSSIGARYSIPEGYRSVICYLQIHSGLIFEVIIGLRQVFVKPLYVERGVVCSYVLDSSEV